VAHDHDRGPDLEAMLDEGRINDLLAAVTLEDIAESWACYHRRDPNTYVDPDWWAVEFWQGPAFDLEDVARTGLIALAKASDPDLLGYLGAGPLEVFINNDEGRIAWMEQAAALDSALRTALRNVWCWGEIDADFFSRLEAAAGAPLPRPR
jgi:hypothetical protein